MSRAKTHKKAICHIGLSGIPLGITHYALRAAKGFPTSANDSYETLRTPERAGGSGCRR